MQRLFLSTYQGRVATLLFTPGAAPTEALEELASTDAVGSKPTWLSLDKTRSILYSTEGGTGGGQGALKSFTIRPDGSLDELASVKIPVSAASQMLFRGGNTMTIPFYYSGSVETYNLKHPANLHVLQETSCAFFEPGPGRRQDQPRPHHAMIDPTGRYMVVPDVGADIVRVFGISEDDESPAQLTEIPGLHLPRPTFPRQAAFVRLGNKTIIYVLTEDSNRLLSFETSTFGKNQMQSLIPEWKDYAGSAHGTYPKACHITVVADNKFVVVSLRGDKSHVQPSPFDADVQVEGDSLVSYAIDQETGALTIAHSDSAGGSVPRHFAINKVGDLVAVVAQKSGWLSIFEREPVSGRLRSLVAVRGGYGEPSKGHGGEIVGPVHVVWDE